MEKIANFLEKHGVKMSQILVIVVGFLVVAAAGLAWFFSTEDNDLLSGNVLARVGDQEITEADLNEKIFSRNFSGTASSPQNISQEEKDRLLEELIEYAIAKLEAEELGISVTDEEVITHLQSELGEQYSYYTDEEKELAKESVRNMFLLQKVKDSQIGWREGTYLAFNFHKYLEDEGYNTEGQGNQELINSQKTAAKTLADSISNSLKNKTITLEQAKQQLINDSNVGNQAMLPRTPVMFANFDQEKFTSSMAPFDTEKVKNAVYALNNGDISQPVADQAEFGGKMTDYRYLVFIITNASDGKYKGASEWLEAMKTKYGVTTKTSLSEKAISYIKEKLTGKAEAALPNLSTLKACNKCNRDNADLVFYTRILRADGTYEPLDFRAADDSPRDVIITGGADSDPALAPNSTNTSCPNRVFEIRTGTTTYGLISLCHLEKSFYCSTASASSVYLPRYVTTDVAVNSMLEDTFATHPDTRWAWYYKDAVNPDYTFDGSSTDLTYVRARLSLNAADNGGTTRNGDTVQNGFTWRPVYKRVLTAHKEGTGYGTITSNTNWLDNSINLDCTVGSTTCTDKTLGYELLYGEVAKNAVITATPSTTDTAVDFSVIYTDTGATAPACTVATLANGVKTCTIAMDKHKTVNVTFTAPTGGVQAASSCTASPESGLSPLTIKAQATLNDPGDLTTPYTFGFRFDGAVDALGTFFPASSLDPLTSGPIYYTYRAAGSYDLYYNIKGGSAETGWKLCSPPKIFVTGASNPGGGEVAP